MTGSQSAFVLGAMADRIFELMTTIEQVATRTVMQRVAAYLDEHAADRVVVVTQEALAAELGTAREVVFRALAALGKLGMISRRRGRIEILDRAALARCAG